MVVKLSSHYLLDLIYSLLTFLFFLIELFVGGANDRFWQYDEKFSTETSTMQGLMVFAPTSATGIEAQGVLTNVVTLSNEFWAMIIARNGWYLVSRMMARQIMGIEVVNKIFKLGFVWFGRPGRKPPDVMKRSCFSVLYDAAYVPLIEPVFDDMQDSCWRLILSVRRIVKWDWWIMLLDVYRGTIREPGADLFTKSTTLVTTVPIRYELNSRKRSYWWWTRSRTASCSVACFSGNKNENSQIHFETSTTFIMDTGSTDHICRESNLFVGKILPCPKINIKGIGGQLDATGYGTIKFNILDDHGTTHEFVVHNVLYVPNSPVNLFSP